MYLQMIKDSNIIKAIYSLITDMIKGKHYKEVTKKNKFGTVYQQKVLVNDDIEHNPKNDKEKRMNDEIIQAKKMGIVWKRNTRLAADYQTMTLAREKFLQEQVKAKAQKEQEDKIQKEKEQKEKVSKFMSESDKAIDFFEKELYNAFGNETDKDIKKQIAKDVVRSLDADKQRLIRKRKMLNFIESVKSKSKNYKLVLNEQKALKHIHGTKEYDSWKRDNPYKQKSYITIPTEEITKFVKENAGKGIPYFGILNYHHEDKGQYIEIFKFDTPVGVDVRNDGSNPQSTNYIAVHHGRNGFHVVPMKYNKDFDSDYFSKENIFTI